MRGRRTCGCACPLLACRVARGGLPVLTVRCLPGATAATWCRFGPAHTQRAADNKLLVRSVFDASLMSRLVIFMEFVVLHLEVCEWCVGW